ncbi:hypothetical protein I7I50_09261 [Histoplasma capsulatum G186AR]|uniref:Uncharacterized protein n=1 Tax=Ajellomyces capsulatus TaxID=5037 RepID=A0A8H8D1A6_AJECA|nr:hypothetical protein I7I52_06782 [Histoplasma capsulatum]QSS74190.1 hypothetical protein I7I50_09261 [Histoplasma capsulatum G186AR]
MHLHFCLAIERVDKNLLGETEGSFSGTRIAEAARAQGNINSRRKFLDDTLIDHFTRGCYEIECYGSATSMCVGRSVEPDDRNTVRVAEGKHLFYHPIC